MRLPISLLAVALLSTALIQDCDAQAAGEYAGSLNGIPTALSLREQGGQITGELRGDGYTYMLVGDVAENAIRGTLSDPLNGGVLEYEAVFDGRTVELILLVPDETAGTVVRVPMSFARAEPGRPGGGGRGREPEAAGGTRDPALVGHWKHQEVMISGEFSVATEWDLLLEPEGRFFYGDGRSVGGGSNAFGDSSFDTGDSGEGTRGQWRTEGAVVYVKTAELTEWTPYARYYVEGDQMLLTFEDGSKQVWHRQ